MNKVKISELTKSIIAKRASKYARDNRTGDGMFPYGQYIIEFSTVSGKIWISQFISKKIPLKLIFEYKAELER